MKFHSSWVAWATIVLCAAQLAYWAADRKPGGEQAGPGQAVFDPATRTASITIPMRRFLDRECSADVTRLVIDSNGFRHYAETFSLSADGFRQMEEENPGYARTVLSINPGFPNGPAHYLAETRYTCNPLAAALSRPVVVAYRADFVIQ